jgi:uncharacterized protein GlcG (DUF336 family)
LSSAEEDARIACGRFTRAAHPGSIARMSDGGGRIALASALTRVSIRAGRRFHDDKIPAMSQMSRALAAIGIAVSMSGAAIAQGVVLQRNLSLAMAKTIAEATLAECKAKGFNTAAVVVDRAGQVMVILRDEQGTAQMVEMARRKAYTARMFRTSTMEFQKRTAADPALTPQRDVADILALGGGVPIQVGTDTIGGVGSSGSSQEMDDACAKAGVAKVAALLKEAAAGPPRDR